MPDFAHILEEHRARWPLMEPRDFVKLAYQAEFGPEHLLTDPRQLAERLAPCMDGGAAYAARVTEVTGGMLLKDADEQPDELARPAAMGLNIEVRRAGATAAQEGEQAQEDASTLRARWAALPEDELDERLKEALIGSATMHQARWTPWQTLKRAARPWW